MNLLLLNEDETCIPGNDPRARHVRRILKLSAGDTLNAGIVDGPAGSATIVRCSRQELVLEFVPDPAAQLSGGSGVSVLLGHPRPIVLKRMLKDLSTVGVDELIVVPTELGERSYREASVWRDVRPWLLEGASQAASTRLMRVHNTASLSEGIGHAASLSGNLIVLHNDARAPIQERVSGRSCVVAIGSERGWTQSELSTLDAAGFRSASLGDRILRTETASLVASWAAITAISAAGGNSLPGKP